MLTRGRSPTSLVPEFRDLGPVPSSPSYWVLSSNPASHRGVRRTTRRPSFQKATLPSSCSRDDLLFPSSQMSVRRSPLSLPAPSGNDPSSGASSVPAVRTRTPTRLVGSSVRRGSPCALVPASSATVLLRLSQCAPDILSVSIRLSLVQGLLPGPLPLRRSPKLVEDSPGVL